MARDQDRRDLEEEDESSSKSQRKREARAVKSLGERLVELPVDQLAGFGLEETLRTAIRDARRLSKGSALKRQIQYIAKLLRSVDTDEIERHLDLIAGQSQESARLLHRLERWRDGLIAGDREVLDELYSAHPGLDRQHLNHLVRGAQREQEAGEGEVVHYRKLFRFLRDLDDSTGTDS